MSETTSYERNRDAIQDKAKEHYENNREVLRENVRNEYRELSDEEKSKREGYGRNIYRNMSEEKKQRLKE